mmetsp:Transcript_47537/g.88246  ORF Transcript_47537/g.88246 Transcript_47537/m.88246 type:complete len:90 (-) Transcript_47537:129-398(-)|eukprot:CAMPEP_0197463522 /NCGR_PEP_ID=MMETSP1175-20131217/62022_1 /TAXON_ID=1003142 /ORGANISM="Triceratium dubium, Strain CCMP147" /LENGTH=89 /DNA_ID=CAMNT_0042999305 /DNA_START=106 /DNA_END=375 /DNA_ORIENTATION=+
MSDMAEKVRALCASHFDAEHCEVHDHSDGCGSKLEIVVASTAFEGVPSLQRHRKVQGLLKDEGLMDSIHAVTIKAWTPEQWKAKSGGSR